MASANKRAAIVHLRLVAGSGDMRQLVIPPVNAPEAKMPVSFRGLSEAEQRRALAGFPGGERFILVREAS